MLIPLLVVACAVGAAPKSNMFQRGCRDRSCFPQNGRGTFSGVDPFVLTESFEFGDVGMVSSVPPCVGDAHCVMLCQVTSTPDWQCVDNTGAQVAGMTQGVGMSYAGSFAVAPDAGFFQAMHFIDDTGGANRIPRIDSAAIRALLGTSTYTIGVSGYASTLVDATTQWWLMATDGTNFLQVRAESGSFNCIEKNGTYGAAGLALDGWSVAWCRRDDATHASGRLYSVSGQTAVNKQSALASGSFYFGGGTGACCTPGGSMGGDIAWVVIYDDARTDAQLRSYEKNWWGVPSVQSGGNGSEGTMAGAATGVSCRDVQDGGAYVDCFNTSAYMVDRKLGLGYTRGWQNAWATDPLAAGTWTDVGTPTVTTNASAGPFSRWHARNECDLIVDDDGAAFEGKRSGELGTKLVSPQTPALDGGFGVWANASCYLAAGTSGATTTKARIRFITDGTFDAGSSTCDVTGLTSTVARYPLADGVSNGCYAWIDSASTIKADVLVGNAAADQGSITACQCQISNSAFMDWPTVHGIQSGANWPELDGGNGVGGPSTGVPFGSSKGAVEVVFQIPFSTSLYGAPSINLAKVVGPYLLDAYNATASHDVLMALSAFPSQPSNSNKQGVQALMYGDSGTYENRFDIPSVDTQAAINFTQGQFYVMRYEWRPDPGAGPTGEAPSCRGTLRIDTCADPATCAATTQKASNLNGDDLIQVMTPGTCPQLTNVVDLGTRQAGTSPSTGWIRKVRYFR